MQHRQYTRLQHQYMCQFLLSSSVCFCCLASLFSRNYSILGKVSQRKTFGGYRLKVLLLPNQQCWNTEWVKNCQFNSSKINIEILYLSLDRILSLHYANIMKSMTKSKPLVNTVVSLWIRRAYRNVLDVLLKSRLKVIVDVFQFML